MRNLSFISSQNLADNMISVSRLCCPVCWELFQVLDKESIIRGCHPTVSPVVLPKTLPESVFESMVTRFRAHLSGQLLHLLSDRKIPELKVGHHRNSSETGYSATSSSEGAKPIALDIYLCRSGREKLNN
jgi:hypothetical protein